MRVSLSPTLLQLGQAAVRGPHGPSGEHAHQAPHATGVRGLAAPVAHSQR